MSSPDTHKRPTLKTIADITGLSLSTVSLALRSGNNLKQETNDKVAQAARQIGYVPNRAGVRLRTGRTNVLALVLATNDKSLDFTQRLVQGIGAYIKSTQFHLNVIPEFETENPATAVRYILENRVADGVILTHTSANDPRVKLLLEHNFPFVSHGRTEFDTPHAYHDYDIAQYVELAISRLANKNRKRLLLAAVDKESTNYQIIVDNFERCIAKLNLAGEVVGNPENLACTSKARAFGQTLAKHAQPFDGIICNSELISLSIMSGLHDCGIELGTDYDLICRQTTEILPILYPKMDTISDDLIATGSALARLLIEQLNGAEISTLQTLQRPTTNWRS